MNWKILDGFFFSLSGSVFAREFGPGWPGFSAASSAQSLWKSGFQILTSGFFFLRVRAFYTLNICVFQLGNAPEVHFRVPFDRLLVRLTNFVNPKNCFDLVQFP